MPAMKRPAAASPPVAPAKKAAKSAKASPAKAAPVKPAPVVDPFVEKCDIVIEALRGEVGNATEMLVSMLPFAAQRPPRHKFQEGTMDLVNKELGLQLKTLQKDVAQLQATVSGADSEQSRRSAVVVTAQADVEAKTSAHTAAKAGEASAQQEAKAAREAANIARAQQKEGDAELNSAEERQGVLTASIEEKSALESAEASAEDLKPRAAQLCKNLGSIIQDAGLLNAALKSLSKASADRAVFDKMVTTQLSEEIAKSLAAVQRVIAEGGPGKAARGANVQRCDSTWKALNEKQMTAEMAESSADVAKQGAHDTLKDANDAVAGFSAEMAAAVADVHDASQRLAEFQGGALQAFADLRDPAAAEAREAAAAAQAAAARDAELDRQVAALNAEAAAEAAAAEAEAAKVAAAEVAAAEAAAAEAAKTAAAEAAATEAAAAEVAATDVVADTTSAA